MCGREIAGCLVIIIREILLYNVQFLTAELRNFTFSTSMLYYIDTHMYMLCHIYKEKNVLDFTVINRLRIFMHIHIFMNKIWEKEDRQKIVFFILYYTENCNLDVLYSFACYMHSILHLQVCYKCIKICSNYKICRQPCNNIYSCNCPRLCKCPDRDKEVNKTSHFLTRLETTRQWSRILYTIHAKPNVFPLYLFHRIVRFIKLIHCFEMEFLPLYLFTRLFPANRN